MSMRQLERSIMLFLRQLINNWLLNLKKVIAILTKEDVLNISEIAKIFVSNDEAELFAKELNDVLKFVDMMNEVDI